MSTRFTALKIGSGDAFLLEDNGKTILFDSGGSRNKIVSLLKNKKRRIKKINIAICSHNDGDHANGFIGLLKSDIDIDEIWLPYWWSSILQYAVEHEINWDEIERISNEINDENIKGYNTELLYSENHEPLSDKAFDKVLSDIAKKYEVEKCTEFKNKLYNRVTIQMYKDLNSILEENHIDTEMAHAIEKEIAFRINLEKLDKIVQRKADKLVNEIVHKIADRKAEGRDNELIDRIVFSSVFDHFFYVTYTYCYDNIEAAIYWFLDCYNRNIDQTVAGRLAKALAHDFADDMAVDITYDLGVYLSLLIKTSLNSLPSYYSNQEMISCLALELKQDHFCIIQDKEETPKAKKPEIQMNNIMEIAALAYLHDCTIKWFEPTKGCTIIPIKSTNFKALNSNLKHTIQILKNTMAFAYALYLTVENEYSLAFEYLNEDGIPIVRFSADSDCECGSLPYNKSIIITAPHHGSEANANVYDAIDPNNQDNIIWVRSDALNKTQGRPCDKFKSRKNKYCLACKYRVPNKKIEVCFEYNNLSQQWKPIHGYTCNCQPNNN